MYSGIDKYLNGTVCMINKRNIIFMKKISEEFEEFKQNNFFLNFKIFKKKTTEHLLIVYLIR